MLDVAVIGGGFSGLAAARALAGAGMQRIALLEARDRVGGRVHGRALAGRQPVELGATWVGPGQSAVLDLADELGLGLRPQWNRGDTLLVAHGVVHRASAAASPVGDPAFIVSLDALARTVPLDAPWSAPRAEVWDAMSYADHLAEAGLDEQDRAVVDAMTLLTFGALPDALSFLYVLFYIHSAGGFHRLEAIEGGAQESRIIGGSHEIADRMAQQLGPIVRLASPVSAIHDWDGPGPVRIATPGGVVTARRAILALSPSQAAGIRFAPELPASKAALLEAWPTSGSGVKVFVSYSEPFWRKQGFSGSVYNFDGPYTWAADASPEDEAIGVLGTLGLSPDGLSSEQRRAAILASFARCFGEQALAPTDYAELDWAQEGYTRGCVSPLEKGVLTRHGRALRAPTGRLAWAGTETAERWTGYMDGALRAGRRAALETLGALAREG